MGVTLEPSSSFAVQGPVHVSAVELFTPPHALSRRLLTWTLFPTRVGPVKLPSVLVEDAQATGFAKRRIECEDAVCCCSSRVPLSVPVPVPVPVPAGLLESDS